jgi:transcriptional regulator GlxA family with amidase domain
VFSIIFTNHHFSEIVFMARTRIPATDGRIQKVLFRIEHNPATTIEELAQLVGLSASRLGHLFKLQAGLELRHFLLDARMEKAAEFLRNTDMQIKEISHSVGYHHVPSFDRVFRKKFKLSPLNYRRQQLPAPARPPLRMSLPPSENELSSVKG